jgi:hypothetical protein
VLLYLKNKKSKGARITVQVIKHLPSKHPNLNPSTTKKKKQKQKQKKHR